MNLEELLYAKKFAEQAVSEGLADVNTMRFEEVPYIPAASEAEANVIYLYKNGDTGFYDMYVLVNGQVRRLDDTTVDLSSYAKKDEIPTNISELNNDSKFISNSWEFIFLDNYIDDDQMMALMMGNRIDSTQTNALFAAVLDSMRNRKTPIIVVPSKLGDSASNLQCIIIDGGAITQIQMTIFTNLFNENNEIVCYNYIIENNGYVKRTLYQPDEIEKYCFLIKYNPDSSEVFKAYFNYYEVEDFFNGKNAMREGYIIIKEPDGRVIKLAYSGSTVIDDKDVFVFISQLLFDGEGLGVIVCMVTQDGIRVFSLMLAETNSSNEVTDFYFESYGDGGALVLETEEQNYRIYTDEFVSVVEGPEGPPGPEGSPGMDGNDGNDGRGISNIYFEGTELNFEMDDGEVINAGSLPGVDIEYPFAEPVADAAGEVPTAAEFNALLASLRAAGILAE